MTSTLLKYILRGALKGVEEYEDMLEKEQVDPMGKLGRLLKPETTLSEPSKPKQQTPKKETKPIETWTPIDLDDLLGDS